MSNADQSASADGPSKGSVLMGVIVPALIATLLAAGGGLAFGYSVAGLAVHVNEVESANQEKAAPSPKGSDAFSLIPIAQVLTALAGGSTWIRLEGSIVYDGLPGAEANIMAAKIAEDILAYLKVTTLAQIEGASGFQHLREDINERARIRSEGKVRDVIIQSLIVE